MTSDPDLLAQPTPDKEAKGEWSRAELGEISASVLLVKEDAPPGRHAVTAGDNDFVLYIT